MMEREREQFTNLKAISESEINNLSKQILWHELNNEALVE